MYGSNIGRVILKKIRKPFLVKLLAISIISLSSSRKPSAMFTKQNGVRMATWTNITEKLEDPNQMTASIA